jgi:hypothetical protein
MLNAEVKNMRAAAITSTFDDSAFPSAFSTRNSALPDAS